MTSSFTYLYGIGPLLMGLAVGFFNARGTNWKVLRERLIALAPMFFALLVAFVFTIGGKHLLGGGNSFIVGVAAMAFAVGSLVGAIASR